LITSSIDTRLASEIQWVFIGIPPAKSLALATGEVEVIEGRIAFPGLHVEYGRLTPGETTSIGEGP
jgi:hypothetical protein